MKTSGLNRVKQRVARIPGLGGFLRRIMRAYRRRKNGGLIRSMLSLSPRRVVIGSSGVFDPGWIPTEVDALNILRPQDWELYFRPVSIDALLAEHVWEHLTESEALSGARLCHRYLKPGGYLRVAVPDGNKPDPEYIEYVRPGSTHPDAADHRVLFTYRSLEDIFTRAGFTVRLLEYYDEGGHFRQADWSAEQGTIHRSAKFDKRNRDGRLRYTSIILDAFKP
jgi:predicted SAM-dependent methyltransferase